MSLLNGLKQPYGKGTSHVVTKDSSELGSERMIQAAHWNYQSSFMGHCVQHCQSVRRIRLMPNLQTYTIPTPQPSGRNCAHSPMLVNEQRQPKHQNFKHVLAAIALSNLTAKEPTTSSLQILAYLDAKKLEKLLALGEKFRFQGAPDTVDDWEIWTTQGLYRWGTKMVEKFGLNGIELDEIIKSLAQKVPKEVDAIQDMHE